EDLDFLAESVEAAVPVRGEPELDAEVINLGGFDFSALEDAVASATAVDTAPQPGELDVPEPADVTEEVIEVTVRYTGAEARQLRQVLDQLGYRSPDAFVDEMAKSNAFYVRKLDELGHRR